MFRGLETLMIHPAIVAIGECGIDRQKGTDIITQETVFRRHIELAERSALPITIHCVKAFDLMLKLHKELRPSTQWTIHGFRGKPLLARQLLESGFSLSFGKYHNPESYAITPVERRYDETD